MPTLSTFIQHIIRITSRSSSIYNCINRIKYLRINSNKGKKDLYTGNYKTLTENRSEDDTNKWEDSLCLWDCASIFLKCSYYLKQPKESNQSLTKSHQAFFLQKQNNPKIDLESQRTPNSQSNLNIAMPILRKTNKVGGITILFLNLLPNYITKLK